MADKLSVRHEVINSVNRKLRIANLGHWSKESEQAALNRLDAGYSACDAVFYGVEIAKQLEKDNG